MKQIIINLETPHIKALEKAGEKDVIEQVIILLICYFTQLYDSFSIVYLMRFSKTHM